MKNVEKKLDEPKFSDVSITYGNGGTCLILSKFVILIRYGLVKFKK